MGRWLFGMKTGLNHSNWKSTLDLSIPSVGTGWKRWATCSSLAAMIRWVIWKFSEPKSIICWQMTKTSDTWCFVNLTTEGHCLGFRRAGCAPSFPFSFKLDQGSDLDLGWCLRRLFWWRNNQNLSVGPISTKEFQSSGKWMNLSAESVYYSRYIGKYLVSSLERGRWSTGQLLRRRIHQGEADCDNIH